MDNLPPNNDSLILVTNDDGIDSAGILALVQAMRGIGRVAVIAPDRQQSAVGHALTVSSPLRATPFYRNGELFGHAINGTPADCVKLGISTLLDAMPRLVVSGINHGANTAVNVLYSGTISAATEATMMSVPAIAVSIDTFAMSADCSVAARYASLIAQYVLDNGLPRGTLLNVNVPHRSAADIRGIRITTQGDSQWDDKYERRADPMGRDYYWLTGRHVMSTGDPLADDVAVAEGFVSITPIHYRLTDRALLPHLQEQPWVHPPE